MTYDIAEFVRGKAGVYRNCQIMQPKFGFPPTGANVNMSGFASLIGVEEGP